MADIQVGKKSTAFGALVIGRLIEQLSRRVIQVAKYTIEDRGYDSPCWIWQGRIDSKGYGDVFPKSKRTRAHRFMYEQHVGPIPEGLVIDHRCRVRCCVNPSHLEPVTDAENRLRGKPGGKCTLYCKNGHYYSPENTIVTTGTNGKFRTCRACHQERVGRYQKRNPNWRQSLRGKSAK